MFLELGGGWGLKNVKGSEVGVRKTMKWLQSGKEVVP